MKITILGSGTSTGIPVVGCNCEVCRSDSPKDKRLRSSIVIETQGKRILIDTGPDLRQQLLQNDINSVDAVLYTHAHYDHTAGLDDIRSLTLLSGKPMPLFGDSRTLKSLSAMFAHIFYMPEQIGGGITKVSTHEIMPGKEFDVAGIKFVSLPVKHGNLDILGFRTGGFAYITDASFIPETTFPLLKGVEILVLNALRARPHPTHFNFSEAIEVGRRIGAKQVFFTHISHSAKHADLWADLPPGFEPAFDGMIIDL